MATNRRRTNPGRQRLAVSYALHRAGVRAWSLEAASMGAIGLCIGLWIRAKTVDHDERGNAERRALFVGLWPPTIWLMGESLARHEAAPRARLKRGSVR
jgi:hypothetical protein